MGAAPPRHSVLWCKASGQSALQVGQCGTPGDSHRRFSEAAALPEDAKLLRELAVEVCA